MDHSICRAYGVESDGGDSYYPAGVAMRGTFIIDQKGFVRSMMVNDEPVGRNMDECVRIVQAFQHFESEGRVCNAGWMEGDDGFTKDTLNEFLGNESGSL